LRLKLDENLGHRIAELFRDAGHDVSTVHEQGLMGASDDALYEVCVHERRTLVTLDLDFSNPFRFDPATGAGVIVLRVGHTPRGREIEEAAHTSVAALAMSTVEGRLWVVRGSAVRQYEPGPPTDWP
jgi:predicted nuclease of predicted toxin-antitoxin system